MWEHKRCGCGCELPPSFSSPVKAGIWLHNAFFDKKDSQLFHEPFQIFFLPGDENIPSLQLIL